MSTNAILIFTIFIVCICIILIGKLENIQNEKATIYNRTNGTIYRELECRYLGGFPDLEGGKKADVRVMENGIIISINSSKRFISNKDVVNAEIQTKQQINNNVSLGKLIIFGWLAFGMKDNGLANYLVITYKNNEDIKNLVLSTKRLENLTQAIRSNCLN